MIEPQQVRAALAAWRDDGPAELLGLLGFQTSGFKVPSEAVAEFGLDADASLTLLVAGLHRNFRVLRIVLHEALEDRAVRSIASALYRRNPTRRALLVFESPGDSRLVFATWGLGPGPLNLQRLWVDTAAPGPFELDIIAALAVNGAVTSADLALAHARALDREKVTRRFFSEFRRARAGLASSLSGLSEEATRDRLEIALTLLTRLLFLYFIQKKGWLSGNPSYLRQLFEEASRSRVSFYRRRLRPLFFNALNRPPDRRSHLARQLGELPFLNGGLFEPTALEREYRNLNVPNDAFASLFFGGLLEKYQFTLREGQATDQEVAVDPEMLGQVFEGLMARPDRGATGAFFTPRVLVQSLVDDALASHLAQACGCDPDVIRRALEDGAIDCAVEVREALAARVHAMRILDPAVGSGAFLLAVFQRLDTLLDTLEERPARGMDRFRRRERIIRHTLYGVDLNGAAIRLCELRLWLALVVDLDVEDISEVPPLPNLDSNIRQGDALLDPIDFIADFAGDGGEALAGGWTRQVRRLAERRARYFYASGPAKGRIARGLRAAERDLALGFLGQLIERIDERRADLRAAAESRDLFGKRSGLTRRQRRTAARLKRKRREATALARKIREAGELPFFSFAVHFVTPGAGDTRFDIILGNPPWVRTHHWTGPSRERLKERFRFLREAGWRAGGRLAGAGRGFGAQLDLSALFLERSLGLLAENGAIGFLLPAKLARGLSGSSLRQQLLGSTRIVRLEDLSTATERRFDATTYPLTLLAIRGAPKAGHLTAIRSHTRCGDVLEFQLPQHRLALFADDPASPWVLAPPGVRAAMDRMHAAGSPLGAQEARRPHRGLFTGANALFVAELPAEPPNDGRVEVRIGGQPVRLDSSCLRPTLRGEDLSPWRYEIARAILWTHDDTGRVLAAPPPTTLAYLRKHRSALQARGDLRAGRPYWTLFRTRPEKWGQRVAWRDIAPEPGAVVVPAATEFMGERVPIVSLNTVYQVALSSEDDAHLLAAVLNSTIARSYLKAFAERASGGYFRFLGWTAALLPFPDQPDPGTARRCIEISREAHRRGGLDAEGRRQLDQEVAALYGLRPDELAHLARFDARLSSPRVTS